MGRRQLKEMAQGVYKPPPKPKECEVAIPCPLCHGTTQSVGLERGRDTRVVALGCPTCGHSWAIPLPEFERLKSQHEQTETPEASRAASGGEQPISRKGARDAEKQ